MKRFHVRTNRILALFALPLLLIVFLGNFAGSVWRRNGVEIVDAQTTNKLPITEAAVPNAPPFETAKAYWNLSRKGGFPAIESLITEIPPSYWVECEETASSKAFKRRQTEKKVGLPELRISDGKDYNFREDMEGKSINLLKTNAELNKNHFQDLEYVDQKIYGDEAMVFARFRITDKYYGNPIFYMIRSGSVWKIFLEGNRDEGYDTTDYYYAAQRSKCRDK